MDHYLLAKSHQQDWQTAIDACLEQLQPLPSDAGLGFIYVTDSHANNLANILRELETQTGISHWIGTVGMAICCTRTEFYEQPAIVLMVTDLSADQYTVFKSSQEIPALPQTDHFRLAVTHGDPRNGQLAKLIEQLPDQIGNGYLVGGLTSSDSYYYQVAGELVEGNLSGIIFDDSVNVVTGLTQGCSPIGNIHQLTECDSNIAISIDKRPALDVMKEEIGEVLSRDLNRIGGYIFAGFPLADTDTGDYLVRNLLGIDVNTGAIAIGDYLQPGVPIMFCKRDGKTAVEDLQRMLNNIKRRAKGTIKGGLYFSCLGRGQYMFGEAHKEMELIAETLGDIPIVGFYANGEIAGNRLYGYTGVLTLFL